MMRAVFIGLCGLLFQSVIIVVQPVSGAEAAGNPTLSTTTTTTTTENATTDTLKEKAGTKDLRTLFNDNYEMLKRALYVTIAVSCILAVYFGIRFVKARRRKVKRYGRLINAHEKMEMEPLAGESDEDVTVFDARK